MYIIKKKFEGEIPRENKASKKLSKTLFKKKFYDTKKLIIPALLLQLGLGNIGCTDRIWIRTAEGRQKSKKSFYRGKSIVNGRYTISGKKVRR